MKRVLIPLLLVACKAKTETTDTAAPIVDVFEDPCLPMENPSLVVGHGELGFESLGDGDEQSELIHGPQGGYHTNIALSAKGLDASHHWTVEIEGWLGNNLVGHTFPIAKMRCNRAEGALQAWSLLLIWDAQPSELHGQSADIFVNLEDSNGTPMVAEQSLTIWDPGLE